MLRAIDFSVERCKSFLCTVQANLISFLPADFSVVHISDFLKVRHSPYVLFFGCMLIDLHTVAFFNFQVGHSEKLLG